MAFVGGVWLAFFVGGLGVVGICGRGDVIDGCAEGVWWAGLWLYF